jgi:hypothetical protein
MAVDPVTAVANAVSSLANMVSSIAQAKAVIEASLIEIERELRVRCGEKPFGCNLQLFNLRDDCNTYEACSLDFSNQKFELEQQYLELQNEELRLKSELAQKELELKTLQVQDETKGKLSGNQIAYVLGGVILVAGIVMTTLILKKK